MKVALLLTGLARKVQEGYDQYWKYVLDNYDTDVYLHAWKDEEWEKVGSVYPTAKLLLTEAPFKFTKYQIGVESPNDDKSRPLKEYDVWGNFRQLPMFYSWQRGFQALHAISQNYDCVIRSRYDLSSHMPLQLEKLDMNLINVSAFHWGNGPILDDNICVTNFENAETIYYNIFDEFTEHIKSTGVITFAEKSFTNILDRRGLSGLSHKSKDIHFQLLRDNKLWY